MHRRAALASSTLAATAFAIVVASACSSFGEDDPIAATADASTTDSLSDGAPAVEGGGDSGAPAADTCGGKPGSFEFASVYVLGGLRLNEDSGAYLGEGEDIFRAPVRCDGSVGSWSTMPFKLPWTLVGASVGVVGDHVILLNGEHSTGGPSLVNTVWIGGRDSNGLLTEFVPHDVPKLTLRWRTATATTADELFVLGGQAQDGGILDVVESVRIVNGAPLVQVEPPMDKPRSRFAASYVDGHVLVLSEALAMADVSPAGAVTGWRTVEGGRNDFDLTSVTYGGSAYFLGGQNNAFATTIVTPNGQSASVAMGANLGRAMAAPSAVATPNGHVLFVSGSLQRAVVSGTLTKSGVTNLIDQPELPEGRIAHNLFLF